MSSAALLSHCPLQWHDRRIQELHASLAASIYRQSDIKAVVVQAGVPPYDIAWGETARHTRFAAMNGAAGRGILPALVDQAVDRYPQIGPRMTELMAAKPVVAAPLPQGDPLALTPTDPRSRNFSPDNRQRPIVESQDTMLDIAFLQRAVGSAQAVCRVTAVFDGEVYHGTAFRIGPRMLLMINHHVLHDWDNEEALPPSVLVDSGYEVDVNGKLCMLTPVSCDVATIYEERQHDFAVIETSEAMSAYATILPLIPRRQCRRGQRRPHYSAPTPPAKEDRAGAQPSQIGHRGCRPVLTDTKAGSPRYPSSTTTGVSSPCTISGWIRRPGMGKPTETRGAR